MLAHIAVDGAVDAADGEARLDIESGARGQRLRLLVQVVLGSHIGHQIGGEALGVEHPLQAVARADVERMQQSQRRAMRQRQLHRALDGGLRIVVMIESSWSNACPCAKDTPQPLPSSSTLFRPAN